jgi:DnaJ-class molecular chaperone
MPIKKCYQCHGKGKQTLITRLTFGPDSEIDTTERVCDICRGEGKLFICPASEAPKVEAN